MIYDKAAAKKTPGSAGIPACNLGRIFIIVWEFRSPFKKKGSLSTYRARRYSLEFVKPLLERL